jgi:hypothetical protein
MLVAGELIGDSEQKIKGLINEVDKVNEQM